MFNGTLTVGGLVAFIQYLNRIYAPAISLANSLNSFNKAMVSMERVEKFISPTTITKEIAINHSVPNFYQISFKNVSVSINEQSILKNINLKFEKGKIIGIIGASGSGKSTIVNLLCGFLHPTEGDILLDDHVSIYTVENWSDALGLIEKDYQLFHATIRENIKYGSSHSSDERLIDAIEHAQFLPVLKKLSHGLETIINDSGATLSDGQKQRISIARALFKKADVIIIDEATSSLDLKLEKEIIHNLRSSYTNSVIIFITHRPNSLKLCDYVYSICNGSVVNEGFSEVFKDVTMNRVYEKDTDII